MLLLTASLLLTGCATGLFKAASDEVATCPALKSYTRPQMEAAMAELATIPEDSQITAMMNDYGDLRAQVRACQKAAR